MLHKNYTVQVIQYKLYSFHIRFIYRKFLRVTINLFSLNHKIQLCKFQNYIIKKFEKIFKYPIFLSV
jgi:hypothetical protein